MKRITKRLVSLTCAAALLASLAACGASSSSSESGESSEVTGQVLSVDGTSVTLQLGALTEAETPQGNPPEMPGNSTGSGDSPQTPPDKPDGQAPAGSAPADGNGQTPPEMSSGSAPSGMPGGNSFTAGDESMTLDLADAALTKNGESISTSDLAVDDILTVTLNASGKATAAEVVTANGIGSAPGGFGGSGEVTQGTSANTIDTDTTVYSSTYTSTGDDENALRVDGAAVTLSGVTVNKSEGKSSNTEDGDFYGMNAALLATNGATLTIENSTITSSAQNGNGVFSYGSGTTVNISNSTIKTSADNSGGIQTTGGGTTNASNLTVETSGNSASHGWGTAGSNGAQVELTADSQTLEGKIVVDNISTLNMTLQNGSSFTGTLNIVDNAEGGTAVDNNAVVTVGSGCTWTLTGDCTLTSLTNNGTINFNGHTITLADGTVLSK
mgnify:CR=1 FL=1